MADKPIFTSGAIAGALPDAPAEVEVQIYRNDPKVDAAPRYETYKVPYRPGMRILDVLDYIYNDLAVDIGYRWFCGSKKCGLCACNVNGTPKLTCLESAESRMLIEPLSNLPVIRDLVVDRDSYERVLMRVQPLLERTEPSPGFPEPLTHSEMEQSAVLLECIACLSCVSVCPVMKQGDTGFAGPAVLVQLANLALDPRDGANRGQLAVREADVFKCASCYACQDACPSHISIVSGAIEPLKRLAYRTGEGDGVRHAQVFFDLIRDRGQLDAPAVVLKTRGLKGVTDSMKVGLRMIARGKTRVAKTLFKTRAPGADVTRRLLDRATRDLKEEG